MKRLLKWTGALLALLIVIGALGVRRDRPAAEVEARRGGPLSRFVTVDGLRIHHRDRGSGQVVLLLHGSNASLHTWEAWSASLEKDHRVIALDLPGHGLTGPDAKGRYSPSQMAELVNAFLAQLGVAKAIVAGNSMGGNVAWHLALLHPERVEKLVLVDAGGFPREEPLPIGLRLQRGPVMGRVARWLTPRFMVARSLRDAYGDPSKVNDALVDLYEDLLLREGNREATRIRLGSAHDDGQEKRLSEIHVPTLIIWGTKDRWVLPKYAEHFHAAIAGSQLVMLDGLGHLPMEENPAKSFAAVQRFLQ
jgi:pimeloyl-ACP methyl ester carboxylesterase